MELNNFFNDPPQMILCRVIGGIDRKKLIKSMKRMTNGLRLTPANISSLSGYVKSPEEIVDELLETNNFSYVVISSADYKNIETLIADNSKRFVEYDKFRFHLRHHYDNSLDFKLENDIGEAWYKSLCRQGKAAAECGNCENTNFLDFESMTCKYCNYDHEMGKEVPDSPVKMYKQIMAYEESSGKVVLDKVA